MIENLRRFLPVFLVISVVTAIFFSPVFLKGKIPFPGDLLLAQYQPWRSTSFSGIAPGAVPNKAQYFDTLRQLYPWKTFAIQEIKQGRFPLWNPHNFSGTPLFANFQSAILYPLNILYLLLSQVNAWTIIVMLQPFLSMIAVFLLSRKYKISNSGAMLASVSYAFCLYMTSFLEYNIMGHFMYLVPFSMLIVEYALAKKSWAYPILSLLIALSGFAGHAQLFAGTVLYLVLYTFLRNFQSVTRFRSVLRAYAVFLFFLILGVGIASVQLLPGVELINHAARSSHPSAYFFTNLLIRPSQFILYLIPDLFGNPAAKNYLLPFSYPSKALYVGMSAFFLAILAIVSRTSSPVKKTILLTTVVVGLGVFLNPVSMVYALNIPFFSSSSPSNFIFFISLGLCLLAGFGLDSVQQSVKKTLVVLSGIWSVMVVWIAVLFLSRTPVVNNNIIYSFLILALLTGGVLLRLKIKKFSMMTGFFVLLSVFDLLYFFNKFNSFVPASYVYPNTPIGEYLSSQTGIERSWGYSYAGIEANFATQLGMYSPDGYDPLYPKEYGQLIQTSKDGKIPLDFTDQTRSDAVIPGGFGKTDMADNPYRLRLLSLLGVKYILDKVENGSTAETFPPEIFDKTSTIDDFSVFTYKEAAPRFFLTSNYEIYSSDDELTKKLYAKTFDPRQTVLLDEIPSFPTHRNKERKIAKLISYNPRFVTIQTETNDSSLLYLSDTYYPGWNAFIDQRPVKIYQANYAFRAVEVPAGRHTVTFTYEPKSFLSGLFLSIVSIIIPMYGCVIMVFSRKKSRLQ
ncbi:MAG: YfhO family protein [bacterium]|nr:YfhO family protein [bacterium]